jgi:hypothetical protein
MADSDKQDTEVAVNATVKKTVVEIEHPTRSVSPGILKAAAVSPTLTQTSLFTSARSLVRAMGC